ncbi:MULTISPECIES: hypothetical protein [Paracoccus]|uniref:hypothetical protein n=1 Tax=Paracoccus TaxID=265 RepID=UPI000919CEF4|nr:MULTISPECIES: hypothetical protein [Paracoccus]OJH44612.1 hypothetical protein IE00_07235 [Paracoccus sp. SM22M-07]
MLGQFGIYNSAQGQRLMAQKSPQGRRFMLLPHEIGALNAAFPTLRRLRKRLANRSRNRMQPAQA